MKGGYRTKASTVRDSKCSPLAKKIADALMTSYFGKAERLQLRGPKEEDLGGYCRLMVEEIIDLHLTLRHKEERNVK